MTTTQVLADLRRQLADAGLAGSFLVRDLRTGEEVGINPDIELPIASLVKVPLAITVLDHLANGTELGDRRIEIWPAADAVAPFGLARFRHRVDVAVDDLIYLSTSMSDNVAAEALFSIAPPDTVDRAMREVGISGLHIRHGITQLGETPAERLRGNETHLAQALAIGSATAGRGHAVHQLDISRANSGSARSLVDLLTAVWTPSAIDADVAERVRDLMAANVMRHRLAPDFGSDGSTWSSKTGTLLNLRHEIGVVEHDDGAVLAVAALTESSVPAVIQPAAEAVMARVARGLHDQLR